MAQDYQTFLQTLPPEAQQMLNPNDPMQLALWQRLDSLPQEYVASLMGALQQDEMAMQAFQHLVPELSVFFDTEDMSDEAENAGGPTQAAPGGAMPPAAGQPPMQGGQAPMPAGIPGQASQPAAPLTTSGVAQPQGMEEEDDDGEEMPQQGNTPAGRMPRSGLRGIFAGR